MYKGFNGNLDGFINFLDKEYSNPVLTGVFLAYLIAFISEYCSTRIGFPYGFYEYIETTRGKELWISNVPFMDSLSYSFLAYVAYTMALFLWSPLRINGWDIRLIENERVKRSLKMVFSGAVFFMLTDVIIDPVAF